MTNRELISRLQIGTQSINLDDRLPSKFLYSTAMDMAKLIIKREAESRKLYNSTEILKRIDCIKLKPVIDNKCGSFVIKCKKLMRSIDKIPDVFLSNSGSIMMVFSIEESTQFFQTTPSAFADIQKREFKPNINYFWVVDNYLYIPDSYVEAVVIYGLFTNNALVDKLNGKECTSFLDSDNSIPDWLVKDVINTTMQEIAGVTKRLTPDEDSDLNKLNKN